MKLAYFCILIALSLIFAGVTLFESTVHQTWDRALTEQKQIKAKMTFIQQRQEITARLLRRIAVESQHDPAFAELLRQYHINVVLSPEVKKMMPDINSLPNPLDKPDSAPAASPPATPAP